MLAQLLHSSVAPYRSNSRTINVQNTCNGHLYHTKRCGYPDCSRMSKTRFPNRFLHWWCMFPGSCLVEEYASSGAKMFRVHRFSGWNKPFCFEILLRYPRKFPFILRMRVEFCSRIFKQQMDNWDEGLGTKSKISKLNGDILKFRTTWTSMLGGVCWSERGLAYSQIDQEYDCPTKLYAAQKKEILFLACLVN